MKTRNLLTGLFIPIVMSSYAQNISCGQAVLQLQTYAGQVNNMYQAEYFNAIPNVRCPAYNSFGQPYHPQVVQDCRWKMWVYLNQWYGQQSNYVNNWYAQIVNGCSAQASVPNSRPAPGSVSGDSQSTEINTGQIKNLTAGIDNSKPLKITIPTTAAGYNP